MRKDITNDIIGNNTLFEKYGKKNIIFYDNKIAPKIIQCKNENIKIFYTKDTNINKYMIELKKDSEDEYYPYYELYLHEGEKYRFGVDTEYLEGQGFARFMSTLLYYKIKDHLPSDTWIGICADASGGFWENMGMKEGRYTMDSKRYLGLKKHTHRNNNSITRQCSSGFDREFFIIDWGKWIEDNIVKE
jgi:hypothetical protein